MNTALRSLIVAVVIIIGIVYFSFNLEIINKIMLIVILEGLALLLSNLALYIYTEVDFTKKLMFGQDNELSKFEQLAASVVVAGIFVGVHLLVGISFFILQLEII